MAISDNNQNCVAVGSSEENLLVSYNVGNFITIEQAALLVRFLDNYCSHLLGLFSPGNRRFSGENTRPRHSGISISSLRANINNLTLLSNSFTNRYGSIHLAGVYVFKALDFIYVGSATDMLVRLNNHYATAKGNSSSKFYSKVKEL